MRFASAITLLILSFSAYGEEFVKPDAKLEAGMTVPGAIDLPSWFKNSFLDLREDVGEAANQNRRLMLYFYQDGCPYCKKLIQTNFALKHIEDKARANLDVVAINMWGDREVIDTDGQHLSEKNFAAKMRVMFTPTLIFFDEQAKNILRVNGYYEPRRFETLLDYIAQKQEKNLPYRDYADGRLKNASPRKSLKSESYFEKAPIKLAPMSRDKRPLAVFFEQQDCPPCEELHGDVLPRRETQAQLKRFRAAQVDIWSDSEITTPNGTRTTAKAWAKTLDIKYAPTVVMFDADGKEVFRMEAYLKSFHVQSSLDYVASEAYVKEPSFQRFIEARADGLRKRGITVDLMN